MQFVMAADGNAWLSVFAERRAVDIRALRYFEWDALTLSGDSFTESAFVYMPAGANLSMDFPSSLVFERGNAQVYATGSEPGSESE